MIVVIVIDENVLIKGLFYPLPVRAARTGNWCCQSHHILTAGAVTQRQHWELDNCRRTGLPRRVERQLGLRTFGFNQVSVIRCLIITLIKE